jgi:hypothetical protein
VPSYRPEDGDLIECFYNRALADVIQYDRMTSYFSAGARDRRAYPRRPHAVDHRLHTPATEQDAIGEGYDWRARLEAHLLSADLTRSDEEATGSAYRDPSGQWVPCSNEEIERRRRARQVWFAGGIGMLRARD